MAPQDLYVSSMSRNLNGNIQHQTSSSRVANKETHFKAFHASALCGYPRYPTALNNSTSKRVRANGSVNNYPAPDVTIDTALDVPCISVKFVQTYPTFNSTGILAVPVGAITLSSADGSPLKRLGYIRFQLTLGDITLPVEALVLPSVGPDIMLLDNTIMGAFGAILDWSTEVLSFKQSKVKIKASHRRSNLTSRPENTATTQCSVVSVDTIVEPVPAIVRNKCSVPPQSEVAIQVQSAQAPTKNTAAQLEPPIEIFEEMQSQSCEVPDAFQHLIVARTVCLSDPLLINRHLYKSPTRPINTYI